MTADLTMRRLNLARLADLFAVNFTIDQLRDLGVDADNMVHAGVDGDAWQLVAAAIHWARGADVDRARVTAAILRLDDDDKDAPVTGEMCIFGQMSRSRGLERCVLPPRHEGLHRTENGREWSDPADNPGDLDDIECPF